ncbi:MAG: MFS transporter [Burkholderiales bacterium]
MRISISHRLAILMGLLESGRMLTGVVHAFFLMSRGATLQQLAILQIVSSATILIFSIPIGLFADMVSRKLTTLIALCFIAAFYYLCLYAPNLWLLGLAKILYAAGLSAVTYAADAWSLDAIFSEYPEQPHMTHYFGHIKKEIAGFGNMLTGLLGSIIAYTLGYNALYIVSIVFMLLLVLGFAWIPTVQMSYQKLPTTSIKSNMLEAGKALFNTKQGLVYILAAVLIMAVYQPVYHFWQPLFVDFFKETPLLPSFFRQPIPILGLTFVWVNAFILLLNYGFRKWMVQQFNHAHIGTMVAIIVGICFVIVGMNSSSNPWPSLFAFGCIHGLLTILTNITVNQYAVIAPQKHLSSIFSLSYLLQCLGNILVLTLIKQFIGTQHLGIIFASCSIPMFILSLVFILGKALQKPS